MPISIGSVLLDNFEVPSIIQYGGTQRTATHYLADGTRIVDILGPEEMDVKFSGIMTGADALTRTRELDELRRKGTRTTLRWSGFEIPVILRQFMVEYLNEFWIQYSVSCLVIEQLGQLTEPSLVTLAFFDDAAITDIGQIEDLDAVRVRSLMDRAGALISQSRTSPDKSPTEDELSMTVRKLDGAIAKLETQLELDGNPSIISPGGKVQAATLRLLASAVRLSAILRGLAGMLITDRQP